MNIYTYFKSQPDDDPRLSHKDFITQYVAMASIIDLHQCY